MSDSNITFDNAVDGTSGDDHLFGGVGFDSISGNGGNDTLSGSTGRDFLNGGDGNDLLRGGSGGDTLVGGAGNDTLFTGFGEGIIVDGATSGGSNELLIGGDGADLFFVENIAPTGVALTGFNNDVTIADFEVGVDKIDISRFSGGFETFEELVAASSSDGNDTVIQFGEMHSIILKGVSIADLSETDFTGYRSYEGLNIVGNDDSEYLSGTGNHDTISGGAGDDTVNGGAGDDILYGGDGIDDLYGDDGDDLLVSGSSENSMYSYASERLDGGAGNDTLDASEATADTVFLRGGAGDDLVIGGQESQNFFTNITGSDTLIGGFSSDSFLFQFPDQGDVGNITIANFNANNDRIDFSGSDIEVYSFEELLDAASEVDGNIVLTFGATTITILDQKISNLDEFYSFRFGVSEDGNASADTLEGFAGVDTLSGAEGNDLLIGRGDRDFLNGGAGNDLLMGGNGDDFLEGEGLYDEITANSDDTLLGGAGSDSLYGRHGDDLLVSGTSGEYAEQLEGGTGNDTLDASEATRNFTRLNGGDGNDIIIGSAYDDKITVSDGNDIMTGGAGRDSYDFSFYDANSDTNSAVITDFVSGEDIIDLSNSNIEIYSFAGLVSAATEVDGNVVIDLGEASLTLQGQQISNLNVEDFVLGLTLLGTADDDQLVGSEGSDIIEGYEGNDTLQGGSGIDSLRGGDGDDLLLSGNGDTADINSGELLEGGLGNDTLDASESLSNFNSLVGGYGHDLIIGGAGNDLLYGSYAGGEIDPNDPAENDTLTGGAGRDIFVFNGLSGNDVITDFTPGEDFLILNGVDVPFVTFEDFAAASAQVGDDTVVDMGNGSTLTLQNVSLSDITEFDINLESFFEGGSCDDLLEGTDGDDDLNGNAGNDTIYGGEGNDFIRGDTGNDYIHTGNGDFNSAFGGNDSDTLVGGAGDDYLSGGEGDDVIDGGDSRFGGDWVSYFSADSSVVVDLGAGVATSDGEGGSDQISNIENVAGGYDTADQITGNDADNDLIGYGGNDTLSGGAGNDYLSGDDGNDVLSGGANDDFVRGGSGADTVSGDAGDDYLSGQSGNDMLSGGAGDDTIDGGTGDDTIDGGDGIDTVRIKGHSADYDISVDTVSETVTITDLDGESDILSNVEFVKFDDREVELKTSNTGPVATADTATFNETGNGTINLLANDSDADGDALELVSVDTDAALGNVAIVDAARGIVSYNADGAFDYLAAGEQATDTFTYKVTDGLEVVEQTVTITINGEGGVSAVAFDVEENIQGAKVAEVVVADAQSGDSYSVVNATTGVVDDRFVVGAPDASTGVAEISLAPTAAFDYEAEDSVTLSVALNRDGQVIETIDVTINVTDVAAGSAQDGYIANAFVFADSDNDGAYSAGDLFTFTDAAGRFELPSSATGTVTLVGDVANFFGGSANIPTEIQSMLPQDGDGNPITLATDITVNLAFDGVLTAPEGSMIVNPVTTVVTEITKTNGGDVAAAQDTVATAFGIDTNVDLTSFDPVAATLQGDANGEAVFQAATQILNTVSLAASVAEGAGATADDAEAAAFTAISAVIDTAAQSVSTVDLADATTATTVINDAGANAAGADTAKVTAAATDAAAVIVDTNVAVQNVATSSDAGTAILEISKVSQVAQGTASTELVTATDAGTTATVATTYTGAALDTAVSQVTVVAIEPGQEITGTDGRDTLVGAGGDDTITGGAGSDNISGLFGDDTLIGGAGRDTLTGGEGADSFVVDGASNTTITDFASSEDMIDLSGTSNSLVDLAAVTAAATASGSDLVIDLGNDNSLTIANTTVSDLTTGNIIFETNVAPTSNGGTASGTEDNTVTINVADFGFADADAGDTLQAVRFDTAPQGLTLFGSQVQAGQVVTAADIAAGDLVFAPAADVSGTAATATVTVGDGTAFAANTSTLTIDLAAVADTVADEATTTEAEAVTIDVLANDTFEGTPSLLNAVVSDGSGSVEIVSGQLVYTPSSDLASTLNSGQSAVETITYTVSVGGSTETGTVSVTVQGQGSTSSGSSGSAGGSSSGGSSSGAAAGGSSSSQTPDVSETVDQSAAETAQTVSTGDQADAVYVGSGDDVVETGAGDDFVILGNGSDNAMLGAGNDISFAGRDDMGDDTVDGGAGADIIGTGAGNDNVFGGAGSDTLYLSSGDDIADAGINDDAVYGGLGNDTLNGGDGNDLLFNGQGTDSVIGGAGDDTLWAGAGDDVLTGGEGADTFIFGQVSGNDTITDFDQDADTLDLQYAAAGFADRQAVIDAAAEVVDATTGTGVQITLGDDQSVTLNGVTLDDLTALTIVI